MDEENKTELDWLYLPTNAESKSLWSCLHDGEIVSCQSNLINRNTLFECKISHLLDESEQDLKFLLLLEEVTSVRAFVYFRSEEKFSVPQSVSREEASRLIKEYQSRWREESIAWKDFEKNLPENPFSISDADIVSNENQTALKVGGPLDVDDYYDLYCTIIARGSRIKASRSDGQDFNFEKLIKLGEDYWNSFGKR